MGPKVAGPTNDGNNDHRISGINPFSNLRIRVRAIMLGALLCALILLAPLARGRQPSQLERSLLAGGSVSLTNSFNVSSCPGKRHSHPACTHTYAQFEGYTLKSLHETAFGLTAQLDLAGPACNAFGQDISNLTIQVTYETQARCVDKSRVAG